MRTTSTLAALALTSVVLVTGCSEVKDAASDRASAAACSVTQKAVDGVAGQVDNAIDEIGADPAAAKKKLSGLRDVLETAQSGISGDAKEELAQAADALGTLAGEAGDAAKGADIDTSAVDNAKFAFGDAIDGVRDFC